MPSVESVKKDLEALDTTGQEEILDYHIYWFKLLQYFNAEKDTVKSKQLFVQASTAHSDTKSRNFKIGQPIYV